MYKIANFLCTRTCFQRIRKKTNTNVGVQSCLENNFIPQKLVIAVQKKIYIDTNQKGFVTILGIKPTQ